MNHSGIEKPPTDASAAGEAPADRPASGTSAALRCFDEAQSAAVHRAVALAEEMVSNAYKMSTSQWLSSRFDVSTLADLKPDEIVHGPFAQVIRYEGKRKDSPLGSGAYDFYKICLQDHSILETLERYSDLSLLPFVLYIVVHELIHVVRFSRFAQNFEASPREMMAEEARVHGKTHHILSRVRISGMPPVLDFYEKWRRPLDDLKSP